MKTKLAVLILVLSMSGVAEARNGGGGRSHSGGHSARASTGTGASASRTHVRAYTTRSGKYVASHNRSGSDGTKSNNWSTRGNVNPDTGKRGTK